MSFYSFTVKDIQGQDLSLEKFKGQLVLVVNTASKCGFTPQYSDLQALYEKYREQNFTVIAFPCNQFGGQEPGGATEIAEFCDLNFHTTFPLMDKIDVNGEKAHPLYTYLKKSLPGIMGTKDIKWNFTKFLIGRDGVPLKRFAPQDNGSSIDSFLKKEELVS